MSFLNKTSRRHAKTRSFADIQKACLRSGTLFEDPDFPAVEKSVFFTVKPPRPFVWKRPSEICSDPQLFVGGASRFDVAQGQLGDCWLLASLACLTLHDSLLHRVVPLDQGFGKDYCGVFKFNFWRYGEWTEVVVDDRLPTYNNRLVFTHSASRDEFWSALLEKAYAKLVGSYEFLKGGLMGEGLEDFTGGLGEYFELKSPDLPGDMFRIMEKAHERMSLMGCSITPDPNVVEAKLDTGLIKGHAYSITAVRRVVVRGQEVKLIRIRNPWGQKEWNGAWSDNSGDWKGITQSEKERLGLVSMDDGEFWMSFQDFMRHFTNMEVCHLAVDSMECIQADPNVKRWVTEQKRGRWQIGSTAGGCRNKKDTFGMNPQFSLKLEEADDDGKVPFIVAVMQEGSRKRKATRKDMMSIGFIIYKVEGEDEKLIKLLETDKIPIQYFLTHKSSGSSGSFTDGREIVKRFENFGPGQYVIIPSTFEANKESNFLIRIYSEQPATSAKIDVQPRIVKQSVERPPVSDELNSKLKSLFDAFAGVDRKIDARELQQLLTKMSHGLLAVDTAGFEMEVARSLIAMFDNDKSGTVSYNEFKEAITCISHWKKSFLLYDRDNSKSIDSHELRQALTALGYRISDDILSVLCARYSGKSNKIGYAEFVLCVARVKEALEMFEEATRASKTDTIVCTLEEWIGYRVFV